MDEKKIPGDDIAFEHVGIDDGGDGPMPPRYLSMTSSKDGAGVSCDNNLSDREEKQQKISSILQAVNVRDYGELASLATSEGGYIDDETRRVACEYTEQQQESMAFLFLL